MNSRQGGRCSRITSGAKGLLRTLTSHHRHHQSCNEGSPLASAAPGSCPSSSAPSSWGITVRRLLSRGCFRIRRTQRLRPSRRPPCSSHRLRNLLRLTGFRVEPSSLKEADAWFETLPRNSDALLDPDVARGLELDPATIRFVQSSGAEFQVWVARKLDGDLCIVGSEAEGVSAFAGCNTREGFARSGVTMSHGGYSMTWNGSSVTVTMPRPVVTR